MVRPLPMTEFAAPMVCLIWFCCRELSTRRALVRPHIFWGDCGRCSATARCPRGEIRSVQARRAIPLAD